MKQSILFMCVFFSLSCYACDDKGKGEAKFYPAIQESGNSAAVVTCGGVEVDLSYYSKPTEECIATEWPEDSLLAGVIMFKKRTGYLQYSAQEKNGKNIVFNIIGKEVAVLETHENGVTLLPLEKAHGQLLWSNLTSGMPLETKLKLEKLAVRATSILDFGGGILPEGDYAQHLDGNATSASCNGGPDVGPYRAYYK